VKLFYDSSRSILTIFPMPYPPHGYAQTWVVTAAHDAARDSLHDLSAHAKLIMYSDAHSNEFEREWKDSWEMPDLRIIWDDAEAKDAETVVEIGDSQSRDSLLRVKDALLQGTSVVERVLLMNFVEDPPYRRPKFEDVDVSQLQSVHKKEVECLSESGPVRYKGVQWVGTTTVTWEVWERAAVSGDGSQQVFKASLMPWDGQTTFPLCPVPSTIAPNVEPFSIPPLQMKLFQMQWQRALVEKAMVRMGSYVEAANRR
jgi:hypothetical protein